LISHPFDTAAAVEAKAVEGLRPQWAIPEGDGDSLLYNCTLLNAFSRPVEGLEMRAKPHLAVASPFGEKRSVSRGRRANADYRKREHLTDAEVERLIETAKANRHGHRDATMILVAYRVHPRHPLGFAKGWGPASRLRPDASRWFQGPPWLSFQPDLCLTWSRICVSRAKNP
jgi:hypothetical protein